MRPLEELEKIARELDPEEEQRLVIWQTAIAYANQYLNELPGYPGFTRGSFEQLAALSIEAEGKPMSTLLDVLRKEVDAVGITSASGRHMGFIPGGGLWASALADMLSDITNKYSGIAYSGPGSVKIEGQVIRWLTGLAGYPGAAYGNLTSGGSVANLIAIQAARDARGIGSANVRRAVIYCGEQTHHCIYKALHTTGLHEAVLRKIPLDPYFRIDLVLLEEQLAADKASGLEPFMVIGSAGTTDTGAVDPLDRLADLCEKWGTWYHVDAAYGGFFVLVEACRERLKGMERSDSLVLDPHKTMFLPFGSGAVLLREGSLLLGSNLSRASYLIDTDNEEDINPSDTGIELTRPNRGLRMWLPLQLHGTAAFSACLEEKLVLARYFYGQIRSFGFETGPYPDLTVVIFRHPEGENSAVNRQLIDLIHEDGRVFLSSTVIRGKLWLRCAIVSHRTHRTEIDLALRMIREASDKIIPG